MTDPVVAKFFEGLMDSSSDEDNDYVGKSKVQAKNE